MQFEIKILWTLVIVLLCARRARLQDTQCMSGFIDENVLRNKAALIGQTVIRQREQVVIPAIQFTCSGTLTKWRFVAERSSSGSVRNSYPELQIWRPQSSQFYNKIHGVTLVPQSTSQRNVYTHTLSAPVEYQAGDVLGIYHPPADTSVYRIQSVEHGGPNNHYIDRQASSSVQFNLQSSAVRTRTDYPLVGAETNNPHCLSGFLDRDILETRAGTLSGSSSYVALSDQQRLILSLTYGCRGRIGKILLAGQNIGRGGGRDSYPVIYLMRMINGNYYNSVADFTLNELPDVNSPNVLEFVASGSSATTYARSGDVIRIYQPRLSSSVYSVYHEPGTGPDNYYLEGLPTATERVFRISSTSPVDISQPLFIVQLMAKCLSLTRPSNGNVEFTDSVAVYSCEAGYRLDGSEQRLCNNDTAEWTGRDPQCRLVDCGSPTAVSHGSFTLSRGTELGSVATYSCESQYVLDGSRTRQCEDNEEWSGQAPTCKRRCGTLTDPAHGTVAAPNQPVQGDRASFTCNTNYDLVGEPTTTCQSNGQWSPQPPYCSLIQCPELQNPGNGSVSVRPQDRRATSTATFQCNTGYELRGVASARCLQNSQWSSPPPTCQLIQCPRLTNPQNGEVVFTQREAVYTCNIGYRLSGEPNQSCQLNGEWSAQTPTCDLRQCPILQSPRNGRVEYTNTRYVLSSAEYTCNRGYRLEGEARLSCQLTGEWSSSAPHCEPIDCGRPQRPTDGTVSLLTGTSLLNAYARYTCNTGYRLEGNGQRMCQESGQWSGNMPACLAIDCGSAPPVPHTEVSTNGTRFYDVATYSCTTGYRLRGASKLVCQHTGIWTGSLPSCTVVNCGRLARPENGDVFWDATYFTSVARYTCRAGFIGVSERVCQANGSWSGQPLLCSRIPAVSSSTLPLAVHSELYSQPFFTATVHAPTTTTVTNTATTTDTSGTPTVNPDKTPTLPSPSFSGYPGPVTPDTRVPTMSNVPTISDPAQSEDNTNVFIICGMIGMMLFLIVLMAVLISAVYIRRRRINALAAEASNSVENPVYTGHGATPMGSLNCFRADSEHQPPKRDRSGQNLQDFGFQSIAESEKESDDQFGVSTGAHLYDFPMVHDNREGRNIYGHYEEASGIGHSYEFPDHYHLATQYEVPVAPYERPRPQARLHIYKNTLPEDVYVPTLEERRTSVSIERQRLVSRRPSTISGQTEESLFFEETSTYWRPASDPASLYEQLARNKYREICRKHIQVTESLGSGQFGQVNKGIWQKPSRAVEVAIKMLKEGATEEDKVRFLQEAAISGQFQHPNVVRLQGVVTVGEPIMIILELLPNGDLRDFLIKQRPAPGELLEEEWPKQLLDFSRDVAAGVNYLANKAFVHRDLAARNILVAEDRTCKIGDFGMSRDLDEENYYISNGGKIPVKWTAPQALHYKKYSTASDVWSFGIVMFEIWSLGHKPFEKYSNAEAIKMTDQGLRLAPPPGCPRAIYQLMIQCWHPRTALRPTFQALLHALSRDTNRLLSWSEGDMQVHPQAAVLGAPLEAGLDLYVDMQRTYLATATSP